MPGDRARIDSLVLELRARYAPVCAASMPTLLRRSWGELRVTALDPLSHLNQAGLPTRPIAGRSRIRNFDHELAEVLPAVQLLQRIRKSLQPFHDVFARLQFAAQHPAGQRLHALGV